MGNLIPVLAALLLLCACGKNLPMALNSGALPGGNVPYGNTPQFMNGSFTATDGSTVVVNEHLTKPLVIIFSQDSCLVCRAESKMLSEKFIALGGPPLNVDLYSVLVGAIREDAQDFKQTLEIQWTVGFQKGDSFFKSYCPELKVPCIVVQTPSSGFVFQKTGEFQIQELEKYTGDWSYQ